MSLLNRHKFPWEAFFLFLGTVVLLLITYPENRSESDDGAWYAALVRDSPMNSLFNPRFLLFLPLMKLIHEVIPSVDTYDLICYISIFFAGLSLVLMYRILLKYTDIGKGLALWTTLLLLFSYEFWRYAFESEVYMLAIFMVISCLYLQLVLFRSQKNNVFIFIGLTLLSAVTVLIYKPAFLAVYVAFPVFFLVKREFFKMGLFYMAGAILIIGVYYLTYLQYSLAPPEFIAHLMGGTNQPTGNALMAPIVIISNFFATPWIFGVPQLSSLIAKVFAHKVIQEELLTASQLGNSSYLIIVLLIILIILLAFLLGSGVKYFSKRKVNGLMAVLLVYLIVYSGFLLVMDPSSNEPWIMVMIPIVILIAYFFVFNISKTRERSLWLFLIVFGVYNYFGGIGLLRDINYDYNYLKSAFLTEHTKKGDLVLSLGPMSLIRHIDYYTPAEVYNYEEQLMEDNIIIDTLRTDRMNVYLTEEMMDPPAAITYRSGITREKLDSLLVRYNFVAVPIDSMHGFKTYKLISHED